MESKRTEKLASALYLLTRFFDEREPMRWRLRELGGRIVSPASNQTTVLEIISLLRVAKNSGLISDTNFDIVHSGFAALIPHSLSLSDMLKPEEGMVAASPRQPVEELPDRFTEGKSEKIERTESRTMYLGSSVQTRPAAHVSRPVIKDKSHAEPGVVAVKKNSRQNTIIALIKKKKEIMIKDVSPLIPGVSEKTIQRELLSMVSSGILRKIGEKRWSRYTLAE